MVLRRRDAGFTYVEVTAAFAVLVVGVLGFAGTIVYTGNLNRSTTQLWHANVAATGALEDVREDAASQWQSLGTMWDGHEVVADGASNATDGTVTTSVSDDPSALAAGNGMWTDGSPTPNFYQVSVSNASGDGGLTGSVNYQTYVADRSGFNSLVAAAYVGSAAAGGSTSGSTSGSTAAGAGSTATTQGGRFDPTPRNVVVSGANRDKLSFQLMNGAPAQAPIKSVYVSIAGGARFDEVKVNDTSFYDDPSDPRVHRTLKAPTSSNVLNVSPGLVNFSITAAPLVDLGPVHLTAPIAGQVVTVRLTFKDGSKVTSTVRP